MYCSFIVSGSEVTVLQECLFLNSIDMLVRESHAFFVRVCLFQVKITETSVVVRAEVIHQRVPANTMTTSSSTGPSTNAFLACLLSNGHLLAFSLPSLRMLSDVDYHQTAVTTRQAQLFTFGDLGHFLFMASPSEIAKVTWASDLR